MTRSAEHALAVYRGDALAAVLFVERGPLVLAGEGEPELLADSPLAGRVRLLDEAAVIRSALASVRDATAARAALHDAGFTVIETPAADLGFARR